MKFADLKLERRFELGKREAWEGASVIQGEFPERGGNLKGEMILIVLEICGIGGFHKLRFGFL